MIAENEKMKYIALLCLIAATVVAGPPFPLSDDTLSLQCQTPKCPATRTKDGAPIILPYPLDCLQYIVCEKSGPRIIACPADLIFNKVSVEEPFLKLFEPKRWKLVDGKYFIMLQKIYREWRKDIKYKTNIKIKFLYFLYLQKFFT